MCFLWGTGISTSQNWAQSGILIRLFEITGIIASILTLLLRYEGKGRNPGPDKNNTPCMVGGQWFNLFLWNIFKPIFLAAETPVAACNPDRRET